MKRLRRPSTPLLAVACLLFGFAVHAAEPREATPAKVWFTPSLSVRTAPMCDVALKAARKHFMSSDPSDGPLDFDGFTLVALPYSGETKSDPKVEIDEQNPNHVTLKQPNGQVLHLSFLRNPGCGGACESQTLLVSGEPIDDALEYNPGNDPKLASTPPGEWPIYKDQDGNYLAIGNVDGHLQVYALTTPEKWRLSCDVVLEPPDTHQSADVGVKNATAAIDALRAAAAELSRGAGSCGSSGTDWRWAQYQAHALAEALYRPWGVKLPKSTIESLNSYGDWPRIVEGLKQWSLTGPVEYSAYKNFETALPLSISRIAPFYRHAFGWTAEQSKTMAEQALTSALSRGFGFYMYEPFTGPDEVALRAAIAGHEPMSEIVALPSDPKTYKPFWTESILTLAIQYPEALKYLIKKGVAPDEPNGFGKTPLMYAAQFDQIESAKILLDAGADPNASTYLPQDSCNYTLQTDAMTPLHYAVRYASSPLIDLLLKSGAVTYAYAPSPRRSEHYPVEWLRKYTDANAGAEHNSKIPAADLDELAARLRPPDESERIATARSLVTKAEADYASGHAEAAFRGLRVALKADEKNEKAIEDLPVVALKADRASDAWQAATAALTKLTSPKQRAAAWFNKALACRHLHEEVGEPGKQAGICRQDFMQMYINSYDMEPTASRATALRQLFESPGLGLCTVAGIGKHSGAYREFGGYWDALWALTQYSTPKGATDTMGYRVYALHPSDQPVDINSIHWVEPAGMNRVANRPVAATPHLIASYGLGKDTLTIIEADFSQTGVRGEVLMIGDQRCDFP
jgi:hypothetical protein